MLKRVKDGDTIHIIDNFYFKIIPYNVQIIEIGKDKNGNDKEDSWGYYPNLEMAYNAFVNKVPNIYDISHIDDIIRKLKEVKINI